MPPLIQNIYDPVQNQEAQKIVGYAKQVTNLSEDFPDLKTVDSAVFFGICEMDGELKVLCSQRFIKGTGKQISGGKVDPNELVVESAIREAIEEIGKPFSLDHINKAAFLVDSLTPFPRPEVQSVFTDQALITFFDVTHPKYNSSEPHKHSDWEWVSLSSMFRVASREFLENDNDTDGELFRALSIILVNPTFQQNLISYLETLHLLGNISIECLIDVKSLFLEA